ncbi:hypothetical protein ACIHCM_03260 [Streptomyces sp. NPDC052023]|uniref:hypothetical protein n=1 Tax=Streptomyces sp. NPDC052023 TaxID=3365681 RepID=UPI0037D33049
MIKKLVCVSVMSTALLAAAPAAQAAPAPDSSGEVPASRLLGGLLGTLEVGHPVTSLSTILPSGLAGR